MEIWSSSKDTYSIKGGLYNNSHAEENAWGGLLRHGDGTSKYRSFVRDSLFPFCLIFGIFLFVRVFEVIGLKFFEGVNEIMRGTDTVVALGIERMGFLFVSKIWWTWKMEQAREWMWRLRICDGGFLDYVCVDEYSDE